MLKAFKLKLNKALKHDFTGAYAYAYMILFSIGL